MISVWVLGAPNSGATNAEVMPFEFTVFAAEPIRGLEYLPEPEAAGVRLVFYPTSRSPYYTHRGEGPILILDSATQEVVAEVSPPPHCRRGLLLFSETTVPGDDTPSYGVTVLDDDHASVPSGSLVVLNASGLELVGTVHGRSFTLQSGLNAPMVLGPSADVRLQTRFRGRLHQCYCETCELGPSGRALLILLPPYRPGSLEVQSRLLID